MNLLHNVGFLKYISSGEYRILNAVFPVAAVAGGVGGGGALVVVVLVVIVTISVMVHGRSSKRKNAQVTSLLMQMENMENAMAEECKRGVCVCVCVCCVCVASYVCARVHWRREHFFWRCVFEISISR